MLEVDTEINGTVTVAQVRTQTARCITKGSMGKAVADSTVDLCGDYLVD